MDIEQKIVNTMRKLSIDQIREAGSGHLGISLGCANIMYAVYKTAIFNPQVPDWINRDRVVLSAGHGSALLYSALNLFGFLDTDRLKSFRKLDGLPGHPSITVRGVDCSTGALGQGVANAVGLAFAQKYMAQKYNTKLRLFDARTFCICSDGDIMEGISYEAASFAGKNALNNLILLYDSNRNSLDGALDLTFDENVAARFEAQGWTVLFADGNNYAEVLRAIAEAKKSARPSLIICQTTIGYGSQFADSYLAHGAKVDDAVYAKIADGLGLGREKFVVENDVAAYCRVLVDQKIERYKEWQKVANMYSLRCRKKYSEIFGKGYTHKFFRKFTKATGISTRDAWGLAVQKLAETVPNLLVGSADLAATTRNKIEVEGFWSPENSSRNIAFGVREAAMAGISTGLALYGGNILPVISTFLAFSDYMRAEVRLAAMMRQRVIFAFSHDSILVGEDGATHQPVEQIESLRAMPNLNVFRPCDAVELSAGLGEALTQNAPSAFCLSRQKIQNITGTSFEGASRGGYILSPECRKNELNGIIVATGSEVELALAAQALLQKDDYSVRVVSMPNRELFLAQDGKYREQVLPNKNRSRLVVEFGATAGWYKIAGLDGFVLGVDSFGETGAPSELMQKFEITLLNIVQKMREMMKKNGTFVQSII